jgi:hypothetical protein
MIALENKKFLIFLLSFKNQFLKGIIIIVIGIAAIATINNNLIKTHK